MTPEQAKTLSFLARRVGSLEKKVESLEGVAGFNKELIQCVSEMLKVVHGNQVAFADHIRANSIEGSRELKLIEASTDV